MADNGIWFKLWISALGDQHLDNLDIADFGRWAKFGAYLKGHGSGGEIKLEAPCRALCAKLQVPAFQDLINCISKFPNCTVSHGTNGTVSYNVKWENWHKYQGDLSTHRVKKFRAKKRLNETPIEEKRGEEKRGEENKKRKKNNTISDLDFISALKTNPAYSGVDIDKELSKMDAWLMTPKGKGRAKTHRFILGWLDRADRAVRPSGGETIEEQLRRISDGIR